MCKKIFLFLFYLILGTSFESFAKGFEDVKTFFSKMFTQHEKIVASNQFDVKPNSELEIFIPKGNISIKTWKENKILIDSIKKGPKEDLQNTTLEFKIASRFGGQIFVKVKEKTEPCEVNLNIIVPENTVLKRVETENGLVKIKGIRGTISARTKNGDIKIYDSGNSIIARSSNGNIQAKFKELHENHSIFIETFNGDILLNLPRNINANLKAKTNHGIITSSMPVILDSETTKLNKEYWQKVKRDVRGILSDGSIINKTAHTSITLDTNNGNISFKES